MQEILRQMSENGVIFAPGPKREQLQRIFDDTADQETVVTGAHVRSIFSRSTLRQDVFNQLCELFGLTDTKIVDDEVFYRFGLAVQLMLNASANARRSRSKSGSNSGASTPGGSMTSRGNRSGSSTPSWARSGSATPRERNESGDASACNTTLTQL